MVNVKVAVVILTVSLQYLSFVKNIVIFNFCHLV